MVTHSVRLDEQSSDRLTGESFCVMSTYLFQRCSFGTVVEMIVRIADKSKEELPTPLQVPCEDEIETRSLKNVNSFNVLNCEQYESSASASASASAAEKHMANNLYNVKITRPILNYACYSIPPLQNKSAQAQKKRIEQERHTVFRGLDWTGLD